MAGAKKRSEREHRERAWLAYTTAALTGLSGKDFPKFEDLIDPKPVSVEDRLLQVAQMWDKEINT